jgi:hypothetical protein
MQEQSKNTPNLIAMNLSEFFPLTLDQQTHQAELHMVLEDRCLSTKDMKNVVGFFEKHLPDVLHTKCFNDHKLPFCKEILKTELAHLFEHVILVLLCQAKRKLGYKYSTYKGETIWDWEKNPKGMFSITISVKQKEADILLDVLPKAIELIDQFLKAAGIKPEQHPNRQGLLPTWVGSEGLPASVEKHYLATVTTPAAAVVATHTAHSAL